MKLLILSSLYPPTLGGAELQAYNLAHHCAGLGVDVTVVTQPQNGAPRCESSGSVRVFRWLDAIPAGPLWGLSYMLSTWRALNRLIDRDTVVHNQQVSLHSWPAQRIASAREVPVVLRFACGGRFGDLARLGDVRYGRRLLPQLRRATRCIVLSRDLHDEVVAAGFPAERIRYRPNGVDTRKFHPTDRTPAGAGSGPLRLLFVGRLDEQKGLSVLFEALALLGNASDWRLAVYGAGPDEKDLRRLCAERGLDERVEFVGFSSDMPTVYRNADLLVLPSLHEGMPNVVLEAMSSGLPVLATDIGGSRELLSPWAPNWLVPAGDSSRLSEALHHAISERQSLAELGLRGRSVAEDDFSYVAIARRYIEDYEQLLRNCRRGMLAGVQA